MRIRRTLVSVVLCSCSVACGGATPEPKAPAAEAAPAPPAAPEAPSADPVDTGMGCVKAEATCGGGVCNVAVKNDCDASVRCELKVTATCESQGGSAAQADGRERDAFAPKSSGNLGAKATCQAGAVQHTEVSSLKCH